MILDDILVPLPTAPEKYVADIETIDDLIDSLRANASAQDYPPPEDLRRVFNREPRPVHNFHAEFTDRRSLTHDVNLDERPVPGYADFPKHIAQNLNFEDTPMPSKSPKQARLMAAAAHNPSFAKKAGVPQKVAREFNQADTRKAKRPSK